MKILVYHPTGNENVRALVKGLARHGSLQSFHTTVAVFNNSWYYKYLNGRLAKFKRRTYDCSIKNLTHCYPLEELLMFGGIKKWRGHKLSVAYIDFLVAKKVTKYIRKHHEEIDGVFCYPGHSAMVMSEAHKYGIPCFYELTIAYYKNIWHTNEIERKSNPKWYGAVTLGKESKDWAEEIDKELALADKVICASSYIKSTLLEYYVRESKDILIVPYGCPKPTPKKYSSQLPIKLLYVGNFTQSKGLSYLFDAVDKLGGRVELYMIGNGILLNKQYKNHLDRYHLLGTMDHDKVLKEMSKADVLVFPTLADGFGMVVTEAMSQGTPVIASVNSCGRDIIKNNENGWLVPIQNTEAIFSIINNIANDTNIIERYGEKALLTAKQNPWKKYEDRITELILNSINTTKTKRV